MPLQAISKFFSSDDRRQPVFSPWASAGLLAMAAGLYLASRYNYLLFHSLAEIFSIVVAFSVFVIAWNSRNYLSNPYLEFVGIAYLFIATLDLLHTLSYQGMPIFTDYDYYANQLWIAARYLESLSLLGGFYFLSTRKSFNSRWVLLGFAAVTAALIYTIFVAKIFPECFVAGVGLTAFKKLSEYVICGLLLGSIVLLRVNRDAFDLSVRQLLLWALVCTIASELAFTFYINNYGFSNLVGHYFKILSFYLVYKAIIQTGISEPLRIVFFELNKTNERLNRTVNELQQALAEVKTLQEILPVCAFCKKVRDDDGYWSQVEVYLEKHAGTNISHGYCPDCMKEHFPEAYAAYTRKEEKPV